jgi:hypothetical protein
LTMYCWRPVNAGTSLAICKVNFLNTIKSTDLFDSEDLKSTPSI